MYITLNSWLGGQKMAKRKYLRRHRKKGGQIVGKSSFFNLDLIKSNGRVLVAFLMFGAESRICSFEKRNIIFLSFFFSTTTLTVACFLYSSWGAWLLLLGRKQTIVDVCAVLSIMFVKSNFFLFVYKKAIVQPSTTLASFLWLSCRNSRDTALW